LVNLLIGGNNHDERDFAAERDADKRHNPSPPSLEDDRPPAKGGRRRVSMVTPVDRENELRLRVEYYRAHARENFNGYYT
jgi:hypothetical protein